MFEGIPPGVRFVPPTPAARAVLTQPRSTYSVLDTFQSFQPGYRLIDGGELKELADLLLAPGGIAGGSILNFGGVGDGVTDNTDAFLRALQSGVRFITFPPGIFVFKSGINYTLPFVPANAVTPAGMPGAGISITGAGSDVTIIKCEAEGWQFVFPSIFNSITIQGMTFITTQPNTQTALDFRLTQLDGGLPIATNSYLADLSFYGSDGYYPNVNCWLIAINCTDVSNFNFYSISVYGTQTGGPAGAPTGFNGNGVLMQGTVNLSFAVQFNFVNCTFINLGIGVRYGTFVQGVTLVNCNFICATGIFSPTDAGFTDQLSVTNCQFGMFGVPPDTGIYLAGPLLSALITNNLFVLNSATCVGIRIALADQPVIVANAFDMSVAGSVGIIVDNAAPPSPYKGGVFCANTFGGPGGAISTTAFDNGMYTGNFFDPNLAYTIAGAPDGFGCMSLSFLVGGKAEIRQVLVGAPDSGGTGNRMLVVAN